MKIIGFFKLVFVSIIWVLAVSILSAQDSQHLTFNIDYSNFDIQFLLQMGILPIMYLWAIYIALKILLPRKNAIR